LRHACRAGAAGYAALVFAHDEPWQFVAANIVLGLGTGFAISSMPALVVDASPADRTGTATGVYNTAKTLGGSVAGAVFAAILTSQVISGTTIPRESAYMTVWGFCAVTSLLVAAIAFAIRAKQDADHAPAQTAAH
jgi:MFS family permease